MKRSGYGQKTNARAPLCSACGSGSSTRGVPRHRLRFDACGPLALDQARARSAHPRQCDRGAAHRIPGRGMSSKRRSQGEGSVFKYRDGYAAVMDLGWSDGKRNRKWVYGKTEREVIAKLVELRRRQQKGQDFTAAPRTLGE